MAIYHAFELVYLLRALLLHAAGCRVFEDLSSFCHGAVYAVPW